jgi:hypothetical protein
MPLVKAIGPFGPIAWLPSIANADPSHSRQR